MLAAFLALLAELGVARPHASAVPLAWTVSVIGAGALAAADVVDGSVLLVLGVGVVALAVIRRSSRPAPAPVPPGADWVLPAAYPLAFDTVLAELASAGVPVQLADRTAGRVVAGPPGVPWLTIALWSDQPDRTRILASGPPWNVDHLRAQLGNRLAGSH